MFTGLIESVGEVAYVAATDAGYSLRIAADLASDLRPGESIAVNGVCLTVIDHTSRSFSAEVGPETARVTNLGNLTPGARVNLERSMRADGRFGGHIVLGHVDGTGSIQAIRAEADFSWVTVGYPAGLGPYLIHRGSVAIDGISLTIAKLDAASLDVQIVPFTLSHTNLRTARTGDCVNLECDMIGKYVIRAMEFMGTKV